MAVDLKAAKELAGLVTDHEIYEPFERCSVWVATRSV